MSMYRSWMTWIYSEIWTNEFFSNEHNFLLTVHILIISQLERFYNCNHFFGSSDKKYRLIITMNPLYHCLIWGLVKFVFSMRKSISSLGSLLLLPPPPMFEQYQFELKDKFYPTSAFFPFQCDLFLVIYIYISIHKSSQV